MPALRAPFARDQGYWLGAAIVTTAVTFALLLGIGLTLVVATWPEVPRRHRWSTRWTSGRLATCTFSAETILADAYPPQADGRTLYPFPRLFIAATVGAARSRRPATP